MASVNKRTWEHGGATKTAWVVRYTDMGGKRRLKTFKAKKGADNFRIEVEGQIKGGTHLPDSESITVADALDLWLRDCDQRYKIGDRMRRSTLERYGQMANKHVTPFLGSKKLSQLTAVDVQSWVDDLARGGSEPRSRTVIDTALICLRESIGVAQRKGLVFHNVIRSAPPRLPARNKKTVGIPTKDEVRMMLETARGDFRVILHIAVLTGMRMGEIRALTWDNVDFEESIIRVRASADKWSTLNEPKTRAGTRDIPMPSKLAHLLKEWKLASPYRAQNLVFTSRQRRPMCHNTIYDKRWIPLLRKLGFVGEHSRAKYTFHALRHVAASLLIESGLPPKQIQRVMGHGSIKITYDTYGHLFDDGGAKAALQRIENSLLK